MAWISFKARLVLTRGVMLCKECLYYWGRVTWINWNERNKSMNEIKHPRPCFLPTKASWLAPCAVKHSLTALTTVLFPLKPFRLLFFTLSISVTTPSHPLTTSQLFRHWKELHQTSSCSRAKCPSTTLSSPGYLKTSVSSLCHPSQRSLCAAFFIVPFSHPHNHTWPPFISLHQCLLSLNAGVSSLKGALFFVISFPPPHEQVSINTWTVQQSCTMSRKQHVYILVVKSLFNNKGNTSLTV